MAGAKGAIGSTVAAAAQALQHHPEQVLPWLTTAASLGNTAPLSEVVIAGWDCDDAPLSLAVERHGVLPASLQSACNETLDRMAIHAAPPPDMPLGDQIRHLCAEIDVLKQAHSLSLPVMVNLLPSAPKGPWQNFCRLAELQQTEAHRDCPDAAYSIAAIQCGLPLINFTPNHIESPLLLDLANQYQVPLCGRDGKTGQTYFKVVLASAFKARQLLVDGWYSLNILGNADGRNLMQPGRATGKLEHKTQLLDDLLGYPVGARYGQPSSHKVHIDYYAPRGDAKEAWDVIDFRGLFDLPMSMRVNLQGRDSILAAPMVLDLARWMTLLKPMGRTGLIQELGFYFKRPLGPQAGATFQAQVGALDGLAEDVRVFHGL